MSNSTLKLLAQKAKKRLTTAGKTVNKTSEKTTTAYLSPTNYAIVVNTQDLKEDPLYEKVKRLLTRDDIFNPIAELTDKKYFDTLSSVEKEKYVIDISKRYNKIKEHLLNSHLE